jgi:hypothetical protein
MLTFPVLCELEKISTEVDDLELLLPEVDEDELWL